MMIFFAILTGVNIVLSRMLNAGCAKHNSVNLSTLLNYLTGLVTSLLVLWLVGEAGGFHPTGENAGQVWIYLGGAVGVATVVLSNYLVPKLPAFLLTLLVFLAQLLAGLALDYALSGAFSLGKLLGGLLILLGLWHYQQVHRQAAKDVSDTASP